MTSGVITEAMKAAARDIMANESRPRLLGGKPLAPKTAVNHPTPYSLPSLVRTPF